MSVVANYLLILAQQLDEIELAGSDEACATSSVGDIGKSTSAPAPLHVAVVAPSAVLDEDAHRGTDEPGGGGGDGTGAIGGTGAVAGDGTGHGGPQGAAVKPDKRVSRHKRLRKH